MKKISMALRLLFVAALLNGCASSGTNLKRDVKFSETKQIITEKSTKEEVRGLLGPPDTVTSDATGNEIWSYNFAHFNELSSGEKMGEMALGGVLYALGPVGVLVGIGRYSQHPNKKCEISFDNEGIVKSLICRDLKL